MRVSNARRSLAPRITICAALVLLVAFVYAGTAANGFINFDDPEYVSANPVVRQGLTWQGIRWALRTTEQANWHPLTWWSHMLDVSLFGVHPGPQHLISALLHTFSALLLFLALESATGARWPSALVAALFAVHPLHVESVAWIAERKDVLCGLFWMLGLLAYTRYAKNPGTTGYLAVTACFTSALLAKPMALSFPLVLLLLDWWPLNRLQAPGASRDDSRTCGGPWSFLRLLMEKLPLLAIALIAGITALTLQWQGGAIRPFSSHSFLLRLENALVATAVYPLQLLWPQGLGVLYPFPVSGIPWWRWSTAGIVLIVLSVTALAWWRKLPWLAAGWAWYLITVSPVSGLIQFGEQAHADRYTYLPSIGLTLLLAWGAVAVARRSSLLRAFVAAGAIAAVFILAPVAREQTGRWRDSETLFRHTLAVAGESSLIRTNLGGALADLGRREEALREYALALRIRPDDSVAWFNTGTAYAGLRRWTEAEAAFRRVVELKPEDHEARFNLGMIAVTLGDRETAEAQRAALATLDARDADELAKFLVHHFGRSGSITSKSSIQ